MRTGILFGASGVGKNTPIAGALAALAPTGRHRRARAVMTRAAGPGEDRDTVDPAEFARRSTSGASLLAWEACGVRCGLLP